jgi:hypothetical protein
MLFDLRGAGRQRTVKAVYITLAFLMGGGLVLFGIGGDVSGGLVDAITERGGSSDSGTKRFEQREQRLVVRVRANPQDAAAYADLARVRTQLASTGDNYDAEKNTYTAAGKAELQQAAAAWEKYLALEPDKPDDRVASLMVQAYGTLARPAEAAKAQEVITEARPSAATFSQLAVFAYAAGQTRKGDLARARALELTPKDQREALKGQLDQAKQQNAAGGARQGAQSPTPSPSGG